MIAAAHALDRLTTLLKSPPSSDRAETLTILLANLSQLRVYLEGNAPFIDAGRTVEDISAVLNSHTLADWCEACLDILPPDGADPDIATPWTHWITQSRSPAARRNRARLDARLATLDEAVRDSEAAQCALMDRLGARSGRGAGPAFLALASRIQAPATRLQLSEAWSRARASSAPELERRLDALVETRFRAHANTDPLAPTLAGGTLDRAALEAFLDACCTMAAETRATLARRIGATDAGETAIAADFPHHLAHHHPGASALRLPLAPALDMVTDIARQALGLQLEPGARTPGRLRLPRRLIVHGGGGLLGCIELDRVGAPAPPLPLGPAAGEEAIPTARVLCRTDGGDPARLGFEALRAMFHEVGHALAHLAAGTRWPGVPGRDAPPLERLELLSTWFEHWVYHPELDARLALGPQDRRALAFARRAKVLETQKSSARQAVCAWLDLHLHAAPGRTTASAWRALHDRHPHLAAGLETDVMTDFTHMLLRRHPGAGFVYPLAQSFAARCFRPLLDQPIGALTPDACGLEPAVRADHSLPPPDAAAPLVLFEDLLARAAAAGFAS